jgi:hypothetical protein
LLPGPMAPSDLPKRSAIDTFAEKIRSDVGICCFLLYQHCDSYRLLDTLVWIEKYF